MKVAKRVKDVEYAIRDIVVYAKELEKRGKKIVYLNIGDPVLYDFKTPEIVKEALIDAVKLDRNHYPASEGIEELRRMVADKEKKKGMDVTLNDVIITNGVSEAIFMVMASIVEEGDEILIPGPYYPPYYSYVKLFGGKPIEYMCKAEDGWIPSIEDLKRKVNKKTIAIVVINPNNPTGAVYDSKILREIVDIAASNDLYLICDEIYDRIVFDTEFTSMASICKDAPLIMLNGFSKVHLMTGWRLGYLCMNNKVSQELKNELPKLARLRIASNMPVQYAAIEALKTENHVEDMVKKLKLRRDYVLKRLKAIHGFECTTPKGAFYLFPKVDLNIGGWRDDLEFTKDLLAEGGVLVVNGSGFSKLYGYSHFRIVYLPPLEVLEEAMNRLEEFMYHRQRSPFNKV